MVIPYKIALLIPNTNLMKIRNGSNAMKVK